MSVYTTSISQLTTADLQELLKELAVENIRLEFKSESPNKDDALKKISSFANTFGGLMVIGAREDGSGRLQDLHGIDNVPGQKQKIVQWCADGATPPLNIEVSAPIPTPDGSGKVCYVVYTPESDIGPHFLNGRKGVYIRTDEFSKRFEAQLATEAEVRQLFDRRKLVRDRRDQLQERAKKRFDTYISQKQTDRSGNVIPPGPLLKVSIVPRFPSRQLCQQENLKPMILKTYIAWRGVLFPNPSSAVLSQHESAIALGPSRQTSFFEVNVWGMLFYAVQISDDHNGTLGIHLLQFTGYILLFLEHASQMLKQMAYSGPVSVGTELTAVRGANWLVPQYEVMFPTPGSELDDRVVFSVATTSEGLREKRDAIAMEILRFALFAVNCANLVDTTERLEQLVRKGYEFNSWPRPKTLRV
jgi:Putative DNA-binding domain